MGSEDHIHALRPGRLSSDGMFLAGRLAAAEARGETDAIEIGPSLASRRDEFVREQQEMREGIPRFITTLARELEGVWLLGTFNVLYGMGAALDAGLEGVFAPDSLASTGGGAKGQVIPEDWEDIVKRFTGVDRLQKTYVMTEMTAMNKLCEHDRYHLEPWIVPFVLDPDDGRLLPRDQGQQTGRGAYLDLMASTYWGGTISGDEISLSHEPCACGRRRDCRTAAQRGLVARAGSADKTLRRYPRMRHDLFHEPERRLVIDDICRRLALHPTTHGPS